MVEHRVVAGGCHPDLFLADDPDRPGDTQKLDRFPRLVLDGFEERERELELTGLRVHEQGLLQRA